MIQTNRFSPYKLLILFAEGSLLNEQGELSQADTDAIVEAQERHGVRIAVIGNGPLNSMLPLVEPLHLDSNSSYLLPDGATSLYNCHTRHSVALQPKQMFSFLTEKLDILPKEVIAIGYRVEDTALIQSAGLGVATAHAPEALKACADYVTLPTEESGTAHLIRKYVRSGYEPLPVTPDTINLLVRHTLIDTLGIVCTQIGKGYVEGTMPVDRRTCQPMGIVHGGANLAFAETLAGFGSTVLLEEGQIQVGMQVSGYHVAGAMQGDVMRGEARLLHRGRSTHVWSVEIFSSDSGKLIHTARVLNSILKAR